MTFRRQRVPVAVPTDESAAEEVADDLPEPEKIEVHVHVHRGEGAKRSRPKGLSPRLTGKLFDWKWYDDQLSKRPRPAPGGRWLPAATCAACSAPLSAKARQCLRCGAPRGGRRLLPIVMAFIGLGAFALVLGLWTHVLGGSVPEAQAPRPIGQWSEEDVVLVEVPAPPPSPFAATPSPASDSPSSAGNSATR